MKELGRGKMKAYIDSLLDELFLIRKNNKFASEIRVSPKLFSYFLSLNNIYVVHSYSGNCIEHKFMGIKLFFDDSIEGFNFKIITE